MSPRYEGKPTRRPGRSSSRRQLGSSRVLGARSSPVLGGVRREGQAGAWLLVASSSKMTVTGRATAPGGAQRSREGVGPSGGGGEGDGVAEGLKLVDVVANGSLVAAALVVVVGAEVDEVGVRVVE